MRIFSCPFWCYELYSLFAIKLAINAADKVAKYVCLCGSVVVRIKISDSRFDFIVVVAVNEFANVVQQQKRC